MQSVQALRYKPERSQVRFPIVSLEFSIDIILPAALWPRGSTQPLTEMSKGKGNQSLDRPGEVQRVGRGIALLFHDRGTRSG